MIEFAFYCLLFTLFVAKCVLQNFCGVYFHLETSIPFLGSTAYSFVGNNIGPFLSKFGEIPR